MRVPLVEGIGRESRRKLGLLLRNCHGSISIVEAADHLRVSHKRAASWLSYMVSKGWAVRLKRGLYAPLPLEIPELPAPIENGWFIAERLYSPCYITGLEAARHWGLVDESPDHIVVVTSRQCKSKEETAGGFHFLLKKVQQKFLFGTEAVQRDQSRIWVADPTRLIIDMLNDPWLSNGIRGCSSTLNTYFSSEYYEPTLLVEYGNKLGNRTLFKRLGYLMEKLQIGSADLINACQTRLSEGYSQLDPGNKGKSINRRWKLRLPSEPLLDALPEDTSRKIVTIPPTIAKA